MFNKVQGLLIVVCHSCFCCLREVFLWGEQIVNVTFNGSLMKAKRDECFLSSCFYSTFVLGRNPSVVGACVQVNYVLVRNVNMVSNLVYLDKNLEAIHELWTIMKIYKNVLLNLTIMLRTWILQSGESLHKLNDEEYWISCNESSHIIFE